MSNINQNNEPRKVTDILLSLEEKILLLIKTVSANDMNNKLILNSLNKLNKTFEQLPPSQTVPAATEIISIPDRGPMFGTVVADLGPPLPRTVSQTQSVEISQTPIVNKKQVIPVSEVTPPKPKISKSKFEPSNKDLIQLTVAATEKAKSNISKIPVGQRITDNKGKDLFMADVIVTDLANGEVVNKSKTNAVGKWQTYLPVGKYSIHVSKITDSVSLNKIESLQEVEISPEMKSLQLPIAIIKR